MAIYHFTKLFHSTQATPTNAHILLLTLQTMCARYEHSFPTNIPTKTSSPVSTHHTMAMAVHPDLVSGALYPRQTGDRADPTVQLDDQQTAGHLQGRLQVH